MQSDDTIDFFFAASSDHKFDNLKDESMDVNVSACSLIPRIDTRFECDEISKSNASFFTAFRPSTNFDKSVKTEQNLPSSLELFTKPILDKTPDQSGNAVKLCTICLYLIRMFFTAPKSKTKIIYACNNCARTFISRLEFDKHYR